MTPVVVATVVGLVLLVLVVLVAGMLAAVRQAGETVQELAARLQVLEERTSQLHRQLAHADGELTAVTPELTSDDVGRRDRDQDAATTRRT